MMYLHTKKKIIICKFYLKNQSVWRKMWIPAHRCQRTKRYFNYFSESEESGLDDDFETRDKISGKSEIKLETQTHMKTKIKDRLKKDQNNKELASLLQNKQSETEKRLRYQKTQRQDENFLNELKNFINVLNSKTKKNKANLP